MMTVIYIHLPLNIGLEVQNQFRDSFLAAIFSHLTQIKDVLKSF